MSDISIRSEKEKGEFNELVSRALDASWEKTFGSREQAALLPSLGSRSALNQDDLAVLYAFLERIQPKKVVEIGLANGSSTVAAFLLPEPPTCYTAVDPYQASGFQNFGYKAATSCKPPATQFNLIENFSYIALPDLLREGVKIDYAFIDGSHRFDDTLLEVFLLDKMLNIGGYIVMDDRPWPMVGAVVDFIRKNYMHFYVDCRHERLTFIKKCCDDKRRWFDFRSFTVPESDAFFQKIYDYQEREKSNFLNWPEE